jgi:light-regulated signal transduction histidine kinase (bacteriophytochrome)
MEKRYIRKDGATIWVQLDVVLVARGEPRDSYFLSKIQDVTSRKDAERKILELNATLERRVDERTRQFEVANRGLELANRELEVANRELEAFSAAVSHDLRSPLRLIEGFAQMLSNGHIDPRDAEGLEDLARIRSAARRMDERINGMLRLARLTRGPLASDRVDLSAIARETVETLAAQQPERTVRVSIEPGLVVRGSATLLGAVMENLLGNAWKFTEKKEEARIEFGADRKPRPGFLAPVYFVRDNGAGFDQAYSDKLFGAFQRLHGQEEFEGTGIGLATVARIIHRHGGRVWAEGDVGEGATFYFTLGGRDQGDRTASAKKAELA